MFFLDMSRTVDDPADGLYCAFRQPPPSDWISATDVVWRSACNCTSARRAVKAVAC
ncbi:MAG: hypothetical protein JWQ21_515, partial [Herminiimonas sp.]|nr:hypothetical protein [Herminiimonas sp.]